MIGSLVLLSIIVVLIALQRRKDRRHTSSKAELIRTFGSTKAGLDGSEDDDADEMAIPDPYVYGVVSRAKTMDLAASEAETPSRNRTTTRHSPAELANVSPATLPSRKGERYLPNYGTPPMDQPEGSPQSRIQEEDIDRLAARMVAMMSSGRLADQAWAPEAHIPRKKGHELGDEVRVPPPLYNDVARRSSGQHPSGGRY